MNPNYPLEKTHPVGASLLRKGRCSAAGHPPAYSLRVLAKIFDEFASMLAPTIGFRLNGLSEMKKKASR
jgi:hypothetical protein